MLPLVKRTAESVMHWLAPAFGEDLRLAPDLDAIEALSSEREALWRRVTGADFLSADEKREAVGYGARGAIGDFSSKFGVDQPRDDRGRWTDTGASPRRGTGREGGRDDAPVVPTGGFTDDQLGMTVQDFTSAYCLGRINRKLPGQFLGLTIADVMAAKRMGDPAADTCLKLLGRGEYRK